MYSDPYYNSIVDLITTFPVVVMPIFDDQDRPIAIIEYTNVKNIGTR
jgi:hypothetical protein